MTNQLTVTSNMTLAINQAQHEILTQATPGDEVRYRRGKGGREFPYIDSAYVIRTLNLAFGWDWDFEADNEDIFYANERPFEAKVRGRLTVRNGDKVMVKVQYGCQPIEYLQDGSTPVSLGDALKGASSDALKKCASLLGVALDLYDSDSDINTNRRPQQPQKPKAPVTVEQPRPTPTTAPAPAKTNGNKGKVADDPMTLFWLAVGNAGLSKQEGARILSGENGDPVKAINIVTGIAQPIAD